MKRFTNSQLSFFFSLALGLAACGQNPNAPECGNGTIEDAEQCDDGNIISGDGCSEACEFEAECGESCKDAQIDAFIKGLGTISQPAPLDETLEGDPVDTSSGLYECSTQNFHQIKVIDSFKLQGGALQEVIYPGMLLSAASLAGGNFTEIVVDKKTLTLSHDVGQLSDASIPMENATQSRFAQARTDLLVSQLGTQTFIPQAGDILSETANNRDELSLTLGIDVSAGIATEVDIQSKFNFESTDTHSRSLIRVVSELYTMKIDPVTSASNYFADNVPLEQIKDLFSSGAPPVYVDTVTYGREVYIMIESRFSQRELDLALDAAVSNVPHQFDATLDFGLTSSKVLQESKVVGIVVGPTESDSADIGNLLGANAAEAINNLATRKVSLSKDNLGQPISFTTRYLPTDFGKANSTIDATYPRETCSRLPINFEVSVDSMNVTGIGDGNSSDAEIRGTFRVRSGQNFINVFQHDAGDEVSFHVGQVTGPNEPFLSGLLQNVDITPNAGNNIKIEFALEEDDRPGLNGDVGDGIDNDVDDVCLQEFLVPVEKLFENGGQYEVAGVNCAGIAFDLLLNFTPSVPLIPQP